MKVEPPKEQFASQIKKEKQDFEIIASVCKNPGSLLK